MADEEREVRLKEIDAEIKKLEEQLEKIIGTATEVYTRIVGYYRSIKNWNIGKRAEFDERVPFNPDIKKEKKDES